MAAYCANRMSRTQKSESTFQRAYLTQCISDTLSTLTLLVMDGQRRSKKTRDEFCASFEGLEAVLGHWEACYGVLPADVRLALVRLKAQHARGQVTLKGVHTLRKSFETVFQQNAEVEVYASSSMIKIGSQVYQGLSPEQARIFAALIRHPNSWRTAAEMIEEYPELANRKTIEMALKSLCEELRRHIQSKRGAGYRFITPMISLG